MSDNIIKVNVSSSNNKKVNVSSLTSKTDIAVSPDTARFYSQIAKNWAVSDAIVDGQDYSSKYYANKSQIYADNALNSNIATKKIYEQFWNESVDILNNLQKEGAEFIEDIETKKNESIEDINNSKTTILNDIEFVADGEKEEIRDIVDTGKNELKETIGDVKILTTLEIGDIGFTQMAIDETKGKRRVLNGQLIIQEQYVQFANIVKNSVALNSDLACTEEEWQTAVTMSEAGICYKFVIDDEAGTIRLPKYPSYFIGGVNGIAPVVGNGTSIALTDGVNSYLLANFGGSTYRGIQPVDGELGSPIGQAWTTNAYPSSGTLGLVADPTKSGIEAQIKQEQIKGTYFIQVATGAETEDNITNEIELNNPYSFGDSKYSPVALNNLSWLKSKGQWNSKAVYPAYYDWALTNFNNGIEGFALSTGEYTDYDVVINPADETFRLPLLDGSETLPDYTDYAEISSTGSYIADKNCYVVYLSGTTTSNGAGGALSVEGVELENLTTTNGTVNTCKSAFIKKGQSYTLGSTAKFISCKVFACKGNGSLYYYVGETVQNANLINAGRIQEKVAECITRMDCKAYITETYVNGTSWYRIYSDGWCEQGGLAVGNGDVNLTVTFLKPFKDNNYTLNASMVTTSTVALANISHVSVVSKTNTSFVTRVNSNIGLTKSWLACGYIK